MLTQNNQLAPVSTLFTESVPQHPLCPGKRLETNSQFIPDPFGEFLKTFTSSYLITAQFNKALTNPNIACSFIFAEKDYFGNIHCSDPSKKATFYDKKYQITLIQTAEREPAVIISWATKEDTIEKTILQSRHSDEKISIKYKNKLFLSGDEIVFIPGTIKNQIDLDLYKGMTMLYGENSLRKIGLKSLIKRVADEPDVVVLIGKGKLPSLTSTSFSIIYSQDDQTFKHTFQVQYLLFFQTGVTYSRNVLAQVLYNENHRENDSESASLNIVKKFL